MKIAIINGPSLNLLGKREIDVYGNESFDSFLEKLKTKYPKVTFAYFQTNKEGEIIDRLHQYGFDHDGIILNAAGYSHTSIAIRDAIAAVTTPVVEVHISNIYAREAFRRASMTAGACKGCITGLGLKGYELAVEFFLKD